MLLYWRFYGQNGCACGLYIVEQWSYAIGRTMVKEMVGSHHPSSGLLQSVETENVDRLSMFAISLSRLKSSFR